MKFRCVFVNKIWTESIFNSKKQHKKERNCQKIEGHKSKMTILSSSCFLSTFYSILDNIDTQYSGEWEVIWSKSDPI